MDGSGPSLRAVAAAAALAALGHGDVCLLCAVESGRTGAEDAHAQLGYCRRICEQAGVPTTTRVMFKPPFEAIVEAAKDAELVVEQLRVERPDLRIVYRHVDTDPGALDRLRRLSREAGVVTPGVPASRVGGQLVVGYLDDATSGAQLRRLLEGGATEMAPGGVCPPEAQAGTRCADRSAGDAANPSAFPHRTVPAATPR